jgi:hypothetical protein
MANEEEVKIGYRGYREKEKWAVELVSRSTEHPAKHAPGAGRVDKHLG